MFYKEAMYSADSVAKIVIQYSNNKRYSISNLKLQKILYFIQAIFLNEYNRACFKEEIEAWTFGPVVPSVYQKYKIFGANSIPEYACKDDSFVGLFSYNNSNNRLAISPNDNDIICDIVDSLSGYSASDLVEITHKQSPWINAYTPYCNNIISKESILDFFCILKVNRNE